MAVSAGARVARSQVPTPSPGPTSRAGRSALPAPPALLHQGKEDVVPRPCTWAGEGPLDPRGPSRLPAPAPSLLGCGAGALGVPPAHPTAGARRGSSGTRALGVCGQLGLTWLLPLGFVSFFVGFFLGFFLNFCCFAFNFYILGFFFCVCVDIFALPGPRRKQPRVHYNRNKRGRSFAGALRPSCCPRGTRAPSRPPGPHPAQPTTLSSAEQRGQARAALLPRGLPRGPEPTPASSVPRAGSNPSWLLSLLWGQRGCLGACCHPEPQRLWSEHPCRLSTPACLAGG